MYCKNISLRLTRHEWTVLLIIWPSVPGRAHERVVRRQSELLGGTSGPRSAARRRVRPAVRLLLLLLALCVAAVTAANSVDGVTDPHPRRRRLRGVDDALGVVQETFVCNRG